MQFGKMPKSLQKFGSIIDLFFIQPSGSVSQFQVFSSFVYPMCMIREVALISFEFEENKNCGGAGNIRGINKRWVGISVGGGVGKML